jgi:U3 small nucleolar RNA-associated protein 13
LFLVQKDYKSALILAMQLDQPYKMLNILGSVYNDHKEDIGQIEAYLSNLGQSDVFRLTQLQKLLLYLRDWNTNSKHAHVTQALVQVILKSYPQSVLFEIENVKDILDSLISYTQRHFEHANDLLKDSYTVQYTLERMTLIDN